ncbi:Fumble domain-containing protein [Gammaproteobacteria bacterium]|jgi:type II pantothenate kinase|nr:Fumble domain-containing protein [Gammaproteobacteria bacterium]|tara:strand:- start:308 stop:1138 length:831 start_codon:yes stop_codon:yes gene_type:complete
MNISADFGITVTDTLRKKGDELIHKMDLSSKDLNQERVRKLFPDIDFISNIGFLAVTGGKHLELGDYIDSTPIIHVNEIDAVGHGSMKLSGLSEEESTIIVSAGSGTACIHAHKGIFTHCSGTGVGGGTVLGLSKLLLGTTDPEEIAALAEKGDESFVDLILEDVVSGPIGQLPSDTTAVNFGKVSKEDIEYSREDIAAGIVNLVGQTAARIATSVAMMFQATEIVVVGRAPSFVGLKNSLEQAASITGFTPHFPKNGEYASALGAMLVAEKNPPN